MYVFSGRRSQYTNINAVVILAVTIPHWRHMIFNIDMICPVIQRQRYQETHRTRQCTTTQPSSQSIHLDIGNRHIILWLPFQNLPTCIQTLQYANNLEYVLHVRFTFYCSLRYNTLTHQPSININRISSHHLFLFLLYCVLTTPSSVCLYPIYIFF